MRKFCFSIWLLAVLGLTSCKKSSPVATDSPGTNTSQVAISSVAGLPDWERHFYQKGTNAAMVYFVVYGQFTNGPEISRSQYHSAGLPAGFSLTKVTRKEGAVLPCTEAGFAQAARDSVLFTRVQQAVECMVLRGEIADQTNLNYLRDSVGVATFLLDHGGFAVCDPQQLEFYDVNRWRYEVFEGGETNLTRAVKILVSDAPQGNWIHTRGLRKFARPDVSIVGVPQENLQGAIDLCNRFIRMLIAGGQVPEGQEIRAKSLPPGLVCHLRGTLDDPDFNNEHVEIIWPKVK